VDEADGTCSRHGDTRIEFRSCLVQNVRDGGQDNRIILKYVLYLMVRIFERAISRWKENIKWVLKDI
jgi:hypothetical protein